MLLLAGEIIIIGKDREDQLKRSLQQNSTRSAMNNTFYVIHYISQWCLD